MIKTFTMVRMRPGIDRDEFYDKWCAHTRDFDLRDHPEITLNRLILFDPPPDGSTPEFVGLAENHWPDRAALDAAIAWYATPDGIAHNADLEAFMDIANSPTHLVDYEVEVEAERGIVWRSGRGAA